MKKEERNQLITGNEQLGRICSVQKSCYMIQYGEHQIPAKLKGSFYQSGGEFPVIGDYVTFDYQSEGQSVIRTVCGRSSLLKRPYPKDHGIKNVMEQQMAANVDDVFIICSLNENYNVNRILRYVAVTLQGNANPVVILTKSDLCENPEDYAAEIRAASNKAQVHFVSTVDGTGLEELKVYLQPGRTIALMGSSGVGKSTLVNALAGKEVMQTGAVREKDAKGRHTTTTREMFMLPTGVTIIDTPGMRELGMCEVEEGINETFSDITELAGACKFRNCTHETEPGCAVRKAIEQGELTQERYELYCSLQSENRRNVDKKEIAKKRRQLNKKR